MLRIVAKLIPVLFVTVSVAAQSASRAAPAASAPSAGATRQVGQVVLDGIPDADPAIRTRALQYLEARPTVLSGIHPTGRSILIRTRFGNTNQVHFVAQPMGMRKQITFFDEPISGAGFLPGGDARYVLFAKDKGGDERAQYHRLDLQTGTWNMITDGTSRHGSVAISKDGKRMAYACTARNDKDFDIYVADLASGFKPDGSFDPAARKMIWQVEGEFGPAEFSPDGSQLLVEHFLSQRQTEWFIADPKTGEHALLKGLDPQFYHGGATWSQDGKSIFLYSDRDGEFRKLYRVDPQAGTWTCLTPELSWDLDEIAVDPSGKGIAYVVNEDGISRLYFAGPDGANGRRVESLPEGVIAGLQFNEKGGVLGISINSSRSPSDVYLIDFPDGKPVRWTESEIGGLSAESFIEPTLIRYPTFDTDAKGNQRTIPAFYYKGRGDGKRPVLIVCHGGPEGQSQPTFISTFQYWCNELGISVIAPNVRGSTGYGRTFHQLDNGVLREDSVKDIGALLDWIAKQPELDAARVGIYGGSYGGYMVLGSITNYPERFKAAIDIVGIASFVTFLETTPEYRRDLRRAEYGDERDPKTREVLQRISPLNNAEKIKSALLVAHGKNDPRVPYTEAEQIVAKVRALGRPVWYALALNEGHGFAKKDNRDLMQLLYAQFLRDQLVGK